MKRATKKFLSGLLALSMVLAILPTLAPQTAYAASATITIDNNGTLQSWQETIQNAINNAGSSNTVTVKGSRTGVSLGMNLSVKQGVNLVWQADLSGHTSTSYHILSVTTAQGGTFEVAGGTISNSSSGSALDVEGSCTLSGGAVKNTGGGYAIAVYSTGEGPQSNVLVKGTAKVSSSSNAAINVSSDNNSITVSENADISSGGYWSICSISSQSNSNIVTVTGGTIKNTHSAGQAIHTDGNINVSGGTISATNVGIKGVLPNGNVTVEGTAKVTATNSSAIHSEGQIVIRGSAAVSSNSTSSTSATVVSTKSTGDAIKIEGGSVEAKQNSIAVRTYNEGNIVVTGGTVKALGTDCAIYANKGSVVIEGGTISAESGCAIEAIGETATVSVSGGEVSASPQESGGAVIKLSNTDVTANTVIISGTAKVTGKSGKPTISAKGNAQIQDSALVSNISSGDAISTSKNVTVNGGMVFAAEGRAISSGHNFSTAITGGIVFAHGSAITGWADTDIVLSVTTSKYTQPTANGVVIAWNKTKGNTVYGEGGTLDLLYQPANATVHWTQHEGSASIYYKNGTAEGYLPIAGVSITADTPPAVEDITIGGGIWQSGKDNQACVGIKATATYTYKQGTGTGSGADASTFQWYRGETTIWTSANPQAISGATESTYTPTGADFGKILFLEITPSNGTASGTPVQKMYGNSRVYIYMDYITVKNGTTGQMKKGSSNPPASIAIQPNENFSTLSAQQGDASSVKWTATVGSFENDTTFGNPEYALPAAMDESITGHINITATFSSSTDTTAPELSGGTATRTSATEADIGFTTSEEGTAYYKAAESGAAAPAFNASDWTSIGAVSGTVADKSVTLTAGAKDIYIVVVDAANNASSPLEIPVGAAYPKNPMPTLEVYTRGQITISGSHVIEGAGGHTGLTIVTAPDSGIAMVHNISEGFTRIRGLAEGTTSMEVSALGVTVTVPISVIDPPEGLKPVLSNASYNRTSDTAAIISFDTDKAGTACYLVQDKGEDEPILPDAAARLEGFVRVDETGTVSLPVTLTEGAKDVYLLFLEETYELPSEILKIEVAAYSVSGTAPAITTTTLPNGTVGTSYSEILAATGDTPIAWSLDSGNLPNGLNLSANGLISGTPTAAGIFNFTVKASNDAGYDIKALSITINAAAPTVDSVTVNPATAEVEKGTTRQFGAAVTGTNNPANTVTWSLDGYSGSSTINEAGLLTVDANETEPALTVRATSTVDGTKYGEATVTVTDSPPAPVYSISLDKSGTHTFPAATENYGAQTPLSVTVTNTGNQPTGGLSIGLSGTAASSFTVAPNTISSIATATDTTFTVTPEAGLSAGTHIATVTVSDGNSISESFDVSFTVNSTVPSGTAPSITTTTLPGGVVGSAYNAPLAATGDAPIEWTLGSGDLPDGLGLSTDGLISGTPTEDGTFDFTVKASNGVSPDATKALSITIDSAGITTLTITATAATGGRISPSGNVTVNNGASQTFTITPNDNYFINSVRVDGVSIGAVNTYTFSDVTTNHTITATFSYNGDADPVPGEDDATPPTIIAITATPYDLNGTILEVSATDASLPLSYQWQVKGSWIDIPGATSAWFDYTGLEAGKNYTVRVKVTDAKGNQTTSEPITFKAGAAAITGLPESYTLLVGQSVKWTPAPAGGEWSYDNAYLSLTGSGGKAVFKALKEGKTTATYTAGGTEYVVHITINAATLPQTGDSGSPLPYILLSLASLCGLGAVLLWRKRSHA